MIKMDAIEVLVSEFGTIIMMILTIVDLILLASRSKSMTIKSF